MTPNKVALGSPRIHLADIAGRVTAATPGVALSDGGDPRWQTADRLRRVGGVTVVTDGGGRFEVRMRVIVAWPPTPLAEVAELLRDRVRDLAKREGLTARCGRAAGDCRGRWPMTSPARRTRPRRWATSCHCASALMRVAIVAGS